MALINCPECNKQVSDAADACPNCAYPISSKNNKSLKGTRTVEQTGKQWKGLQLISVISLFLGLIVFFNIDHQVDNTAIPTIMIVFGFFGLLLAKVGAWWHHG